MTNERTLPMTTEQDQEFELVLGNKQLLSVLFIVFVLLGVFFAMGFVMGRNSIPIETARDNNSDKIDGPMQRPSQIDSQPTGQRSASDEPAEQTDERSYQLPTPAVATQDPARSPAAAARAAAAPKPIEVAPVNSVVDPPPGQTFLQVSAVAKSEAEVLAEVLRKKGFRAVLATGPNNLLRVLVGPSSDPAELARVKADLEKIGMKPMVRRY